jgi:hypothetical protein
MPQRRKQRPLPLAYETSPDLDEHRLTRVFARLFERAYSASPSSRVATSVLKIQQGRPSVRRPSPDQRQLKIPAVLPHQ